MKNSKKSEEKSGRWSLKEQKMFIEGLKLYGKDWRLISELLKTRNCTQVRSHAQKYFIREACKFKEKLCEEVKLSLFNPKEKIEKFDEGVQYGEGMKFV